MNSQGEETESWLWKCWAQSPTEQLGWGGGGGDCVSTSDIACWCSLPDDAPPQWHPLFSPTRRSGCSVRVIVVADLMRWGWRTNTHSQPLSGWCWRPGTFWCPFYWSSARSPTHLSPVQIQGCHSDPAPRKSVFTAWAQNLGELSVLQDFTFPNLPSAPCWAFSTRQMGSE